MTKKILLLFLTSAFLTVEAVAQQDPLYNLYAFNQGMINPAYTGVYNNLTLNLISRLQWVGIEGAPQTNMFYASTSIATRFGVGVMAVSDQLGINYNKEAQLSFSYKVIEDEGTVLAFGVQGGFVNFKYDYSKLNLEYVDDTDLDMNRSQYSEPNFGAGVWYMTDRYYVGLSSPRILNVDVNDGVVSSTRYLRHFYFSGGILFNNGFNRSIRLKPSFLIRFVPNGNVAADLNCSALFLDTIWAGVTLRNFSAVGVNGQFQVTSRLRLGYGFELPMNSLISSNFGTHEVSLLMELSPLKTQHKIIRFF